ncbi:FAD-dependent monooxygenase [Pelagibacterium halotolerans]|uniref:2-octaprenyl-6-methoxyphenyl hydroxylase n=1 Tax=Pelagibacterium halotolerans (strain DSM 22347 / JCM 15775 / CGMCC 1.7692 / B2) TaxID=1082931 RepID=G4R914_PELHB|nr:FAD-dependent monooxygenase [Pelagibacterium halotolerans]AEQ51429.1 2-octaprenyl-6-methoxyphenyl hydroxylase [Pelagibacterium halotolerans B2]QJR18728.1 UbiH/UbiF family hydroxylase [Pelagibacterium halotolerans]SEA13249.1 2-octaprenyl-6-methoxyphenol hydroxylase [Pelagibacterium halotolerans]
MTNHTQIAVIGGGLVGKATAVAAARAGFSTLHVAPEAPMDRRTSALMGPSVDYMIEAGLIDDPETLGVPLTRIRIIDATDRFLRAPETVFSAAEFGHQAFGWNFANARLGESFSRAAAGGANLALRAATLKSASRADDLWRLELDDGSRLTAELLVGADGKGSSVRKAAGIAVRERKFDQAALVCDLELGRELDGESVEFHYPNGPFTLVPAGGTRANLVWIDKPETLDDARREKEQFLARLSEKSRHLFGAVSVVSPSFVFPLSSLSVDVAGRDAAVLVGESAHAFPPIGAQGLNLGLRDVASLNACLRAANPGSYGWADAVARSYGAARRGDLARTGMFVDGLFTSLLSPHLPAQALRSVGLWGLKTFPLLRKHAASLGMGQ